MSPSEICKAAGLDSLAELSRITERGESTLFKWYHEQPDFFEIVVWGAAEKKRRDKSR